MIVSFAVENFLSIKERVELSLEASSDEKIVENTFKYSGKNRLLKSVAIYGANA